MQTITTITIDNSRRLSHVSNNKFLPHPNHINKIYNGYYGNNDDGDDDTDGNDEQEDVDDNKYKYQ